MASFETSPFISWDCSLITLNLIEVARASAAVVMEMEAKIGSTPSVSLKPLTIFHGLGSQIWALQHKKLSPGNQDITLYWPDYKKKQPTFSLWVSFGGLRRGEVVSRCLAGGEHECSRRSCPAVPWQEPVPVPPAALMELLGSSGEPAQGILAFGFTYRATVLVWQLTHFFLVGESIWKHPIWPWSPFLSDLFQFTSTLKHPHTAVWGKYVNQPEIKLKLCLRSALLPNTCALITRSDNPSWWSHSTVPHSKKGTAWLHAKYYI